MKQNSQLSFGRKTSNFFQKGLSLAILLLIIIFFILPLLWMISCSIKNNVDIISFPPKILLPPIWDHYLEILQGDRFVLYLKNSIIVSVMATVLGLMVGLPAAYAISKSRLQALAPFVLVTRMAPAIILLIPWFIIFHYVGLTNSLLAIIIGHLTLTAPMIAWLMLGFFKEVPKELEEAAMIDGCNFFSSFYRIILPSAKPGIISSTILAFNASWNNFMFALILGDTKTYTLPLLALNFQDFYGIRLGNLFAVATLLTIPAFIYVFFTQGQVMKGIAGGAIKG